VVRRVGAKTRVARGRTAANAYRYENVPNCCSGAVLSC